MWWPTPSASGDVEERPSQGRVRCGIRSGFSPRGRRFASSRFPNLEFCFLCMWQISLLTSRLRLYDSLMDDSGRRFFVTTVTWRRAAIFRVERRARLLIDVLRDYRDQGKYLLHEFVVMPDHLHLLLTPAVEMSLERVVQFIKGGYSFRLRREEKIRVWQQSFTNHRIRDAEDYLRHCEYVRLNPVRAKLARDAAEYPYSSASAGLRLDETPRG